MGEPAYVAALEIPNTETAEVELEFLVSLQQTELQHIALGGQGPPGRDGRDGGASPPIAFSYGHASPLLISTLTRDSLLAELKLLIEQPFDGEAPALLVRTGSGLVLMDSNQNAPHFAATYETTPGVHLGAGTDLYLEITPGAGATAGAGQILLSLH